MFLNVVIHSAIRARAYLKRSLIEESTPTLLLDTLCVSAQAH